MIERRRIVVTLYQGDDLARLGELREQVATAADREASTQRRQSSKSEAARLAKEHDDLQDAADGRAVKVTVWALTSGQFEELSQAHPPREGDKADVEYGMNMSTFPAALLRASLLSPDDSPGNVERAVERGAAKLADLGDLSRLQMRRLEAGAWAVNVEDDTLPKLSLVSLLRREREDEREQQNDTE